MVEGLGSTEVLHIYLSNRPERQKIGASGMRVRGYEIKLTDPDGKILGAGESGVLWVRGGTQAPLYWNCPDKTAETMRDGWIYSGDRFRLNDEEFYFFEDRFDRRCKNVPCWVSKKAMD